MNLKTLLLIMALSMCAVIVKAEEVTAGAYVKIGALEMTYPLANTSVISLYDFWTGEGLIGAETTLIKWHRLGLNAGAVTSFEANGMPFVSIDFDAAGLVNGATYTRLARVGVWYGHDFKAGDNHAGIKASVPLWGNK
jgi:hypothetical protein